MGFTSVLCYLVKLGLIRTMKVQINKQIRTTPALDFIGFFVSSLNP